MQGGCRQETGERARSGDAASDSEGRRGRVFRQLAPVQVASHPTCDRDLYDQLRGPTRTGPSLRLRTRTRTVTDPIGMPVGRVRLGWVRLGWDPIGNRLGWDGN
jgi:hypothetical protein